MAAKRVLVMGVHASDDANWRERIGRHVDEEARRFAADITHKLHEADGEGHRQHAEGGRR